MRVSRAPHIPASFFVFQKSHLFSDVNHTWQTEAPVVVAQWPEPYRSHVQTLNERKSREIRKCKRRSRDWSNAGLENAQTPCKRVVKPSELRRLTDFLWVRLRSVAIPSFDQPFRFQGRSNFRHSYARAGIAD
jgi:hypothetical protein